MLTLIGKLVKGAGKKAALVDLDTIAQRAQQNSDRLSKLPSGTVTAATCL